MIYADTSFLASLYLQDSNSGQARTWFAAHAQPISMGRLVELELFNACRLSVFRGWISLDECNGLLANIRSDLSGGVLVRRPFSTEEIFKVSESLSKEHTVTTGNRSLDILHVAHAVESELTTFASFDLRQRALAKLCGLETVPDIRGS